MSSKLRNRNGSVDLQDVESALQGNFCRCTGYRPIIEGFRTFCQDRQTSIPREEEVFSEPLDLRPYTDECDPPFPEELKFLRGSFSSTQHGGCHWHRPSSLEELQDLMRTYKSFKFVAGGTGSFKRPHDPKMPEAFLQVTHVSKLSKITEHKDGVFFGSAVTIQSVADFCNEVTRNRGKAATRVFQTLSQVLRVWVSPQVRETATLGGHLGWAHPCSDLIPTLMVANCKVEVLDTSGERRRANLDEKFFPQAFMTTVKPKELILGIHVPFTNPGEVSFYYRRARRKALDLPIANAAFLGKVDEEGLVSDVRIAVGGMDSSLPSCKAYPAKFIGDTMAYLKGKGKASFSREQLMEHLVKEVPIDPRSPGNLSTYRRCLVAVFIERFLNDISSSSEGLDKPKLGLVERHHLYEICGEDNSNPIHKPIPHVTGAEQATGQACYIPDLPRYEDELFVIPILSQKINSDIRRIDFSEALRSEGVVGAVTAEDVPDNWWGICVHDEEVVASRPSFAGQIVGALVCSDYKAGRAAVCLVRVEAEEKPAQLFLEDVVRSNKAEHHMGPVCKIKRGETEGEKKMSKYVTVEGTVRLGGQKHCYFEMHDAVALPLGEKGEVTVWTGTQNPTGVQEAVSKVLGLPRNRVVVKCKRIGGAFGGKERGHIAALAALAARKFKRPARVQLSAAEDAATTGHRPNFIVNYKVIRNIIFVLDDIQPFPHKK